MEDSASPHTACDTITFLQQLFRNRLVALGTTHDWAPHSPDLNPLDYWFWGAAKGSVYTNRPATLDDLKQEVSDYLQTVPHETNRKVQNFGVKINACLRGTHQKRQLQGFCVNANFRQCPLTNLSNNLLQ